MGLTALLECPYPSSLQKTTATVKIDKNNFGFLELLEQSELYWIIGKMNICSSLFASNEIIRFKTLLGESQVASNEVYFRNNVMENDVWMCDV